MTLGNECVSIRVATPSDLEDILEVQRRSPGRSSGRSFREYTGRAITDPSRLFLVAVAVATDETVAWATTKHFAEAEGQAPIGHYLMGITVAPDFRRRGVATGLVRARLAWIRQRDDQVHFFTNVHNTASIALHERLGFREIARAPQFRGVPFDDGAGILFSLDLTPTRSLGDAL